MTRLEEQGAVMVRERRALATLSALTSSIVLSCALVACGETAATTPPVAAGTHGVSDQAGMSASGVGGTAPDASMGGADPSVGGFEATAGQGGAPQDSSLLGQDCEAPGALGCAGPHQKLTLLCSDAHVWEANQTCPSGQFCDSTPGPDSGICKEPSPDCAARQPGEAFCSGKSAMKCGPDALSSDVIEQCAKRCVEGDCQPFECPSNVYSCDAACPAVQGAPSCYDVCAQANVGPPPLLDLPTDEVGVPYVIELPPVPEGDQTCCHFAQPNLRAVAFQLRNPPLDQTWFVELEEPWRMHFEYGETSQDSACRDLKGGWSTLTCGVMIHRGEPPATDVFTVWLGADVPTPNPAKVSITLVPTPADRNFVCDNARERLQVSREVRVL